MSRISTHHEFVERFTTGTVGVPGERTFFLQVRGDQGLSSMVLEKGQVQALADRAKVLIRELQVSGAASLDELSVSPIRDLDPLDYPISEDFRIGIIGLSWNEETQRLQIHLQAVSEEEVEEVLDEEQALQMENAPDLVTATLRIHQVRTFISRADAVINAGRQVCPFCGLPINVDGHLCPRANGYRR